MREKALAASSVVKPARPDGASAAEIEEVGLLGLGSGIFEQAHHKALLDLVVGECNCVGYNDNSFVA